MKIFERPIFSFQEDDFFSPIRENRDYAKIVLLGAKTLLLPRITSKEIPTSKMKLIVDKMSRLFFYKEGRSYSISFPFIVQSTSGEISGINSYLKTTVDLQAISEVIAILIDEQFKLKPSLIDVYIEEDLPGIFLLEEILVTEPSYIRYDIDPNQVNGKLHPLKHLDVNYSQYSTFKLDSGEIDSENDFENMLDIKTDCFNVKK